MPMSLPTAREHCALGRVQRGKQGRGSKRENYPTEAEFFFAKENWKKDYEAWALMKKIKILVVAVPVGIIILVGLLIVGSLAH
jgi:hypothetical protein